MTTSTNLREIALRWTDLETALDARNEQWPPAGKADLLRALDRRDAEQAEYDRAHAAYRRTRERSPEQIGAVAAPFDLRIWDTMRLVEGTLIHLADVIAAEIQRSPMPGAPDDWETRGWHADDVWNRNQDAAADAANPARWRYAGLRTAPYAALWLCARCDGITGRLRDRPALGSPFSPLTEAHRQQIDTVAAGCRTRIERALDLVGQDTVLAEPCPCGGRITLTGGAGADPVARCGRCERLWTMADTVAA